MNIVFLIIGTISLCTLLGGLADPNIFLSKRNPKPTRRQAIIRFLPFTLVSLVLAGVLSIQFRKEDSDDAVSNYHSTTANNSKLEVKNAWKNSKTPYKIVHTVSRGNIPMYMVLIDSIVLDKDDYKSIVKSSINEICQKFGREINIDFYDDPITLEMMYNSDEINYDSGKKLSKKDYKKLSRHNIAIFSGSESLGQKFTVMYFPAEWYATEEIKQYREDEQYYPQ